MTSRTRRGRHRVRCHRRKCRQRDVLRKHPDEYKVAPKCSACGWPVRSIEQERRNEFKAQESCTCLAIPFKHKKGSLRLCEYHPKAGTEPTDEEWDDHEQMCRTPRSG